MSARDRLIIWCGDSWTYGSKLDPFQRKHQRFATLVSKELDVPAINLAQPGSSIGHLAYKLEQVLRLRKTFPDKEILLLLGLTTPWRLCVYREGERNGIIGVNDFDYDAYKSWAVDVFNNQHILNETCIRVSWLADQCRKNNIDFKFYNTYCNSLELAPSTFSHYLDYSDWLITAGWSTYSELFGLEQVDYNKIGMLERTSKGKKVIRDYFIPNDRHPNAIGHQLIADRMVPEIAKLL